MENHASANTGSLDIKLDSHCHKRTIGDDLNPFRKEG